MNTATLDGSQSALKKASSSDSMAASMAWVRSFWLVVMSTIYVRVYAHVNPLKLVASASDT